MSKSYLSSMPLIILLKIHCYSVTFTTNSLSHFNFIKSLMNLQYSFSWLRYIYEKNSKSYLSSLPSII